jgi:hypothetical protein
MGRFHASRVREGNQILQNYTSKSVELIRGHTNLAQQAADGSRPVDGIGEFKLEAHRADTPAPAIFY